MGRMRCCDSTRPPRPQSLHPEGKKDRRLHADFLVSRGSVGSPRARSMRLDLQFRQSSINLVHACGPLQPAAAGSPSTHVPELHRANATGRGNRGGIASGSHATVAELVPVQIVNFLRRCGRQRLRRTFAQLVALRFRRRPHGRVFAKNDRPSRWRPLWRSGRAPQRGDPSMYRQDSRQ
jgi:hypothetical protein